MAAATATDVLAAYRDSKKNLDKLAGAARKQMQARFTELLVEAAGIQADFKNDFGKNPDLPSMVKAFTLGDKKKPESTDAVAIGKKIGGLRRSLASAVKNGDDAKIADLTAQLAGFGVDVATATDNPAPAPATAQAPESDSESDSDDDNDNGLGEF
jgi:hypothetical protein